MKQSVHQFTRQVVNDNKDFILEGNIAEWLINEASSHEWGIHWYLSDDESLEYDRATTARRAEIEQEVFNYIKENWNFDISDFDYNIK